MTLSPSFVLLAALSGLQTSAPDSPRSEPRKNGLDAESMIELTELVCMDCHGAQDPAGGLDLGADDFIRKPFTRTVVMARIRAALRRTTGNRKDGSFLLGDLEVCPSSLVAIRKGNDIDLTPREVSMLKLLHDHSGEPVSRDAFLDTCWGIDYFPDSRTLDQHIFLLRKKIEPDPATPTLIQSVRAVGYRYPG